MLKKHWPAHWKNGHVNISFDQVNTTLNLGVSVRWFRSPQHWIKNGLEAFLLTICLDLNRLKVLPPALTKHCHLVAQQPHCVSLHSAWTAGACVGWFASVCWLSLGNAGFVSAIEYFLKLLCCILNILVDYSLCCLKLKKQAMMCIHSHKSVFSLILNSWDQ